ESARQPRERRSVLDTLGRISDVLAKVGGAEALYQPTLDAREDRTIAQGDHARAVDLDALKKKLVEQQIGQNTTADTNLADDRQRAILGQAVKGLAAISARSGPAGVAAAWPQMAQMLGLDQAKTQEIGQALAADPEGTLTGLAAALDPTARSGSQAKELQVYGLLKQNNPELAEKYLAGIASGKGAQEMTPYQQAQVNLAMRRQGFNEYKFQHPQVKPDAKAAAAEQDQVAAAEAAVPIITSLRDAIERMKNSGSMNAPGQSAEGRVGAWAMQNVPGLERITNPEGFSARQDFNRLTTQGIGSLLPLLGGIKLGGKNIDAAKELDTWKNAITSATDYNSAMRALKGFEDRIEQLTSGPAARAPAASSGGGRRILPRAAPRCSCRCVKRRVGQGFGGEIMATYSIKAPNGKTYRIDGPDGADDAAVRAQVLKQYPDAGRPATSAAPKSALPTRTAAPQPTTIPEKWKRIPKAKAAEILTNAQAAIMKNLGPNATEDQKSRALSRFNADPRMAAIRQIAGMAPLTTRRDEIRRVARETVAQERSSGVPDSLIAFKGGVTRGLFGIPERLAAAGLKLTGNAGD